MSGNHSVLDRYVDHNSPVHSLDARVKFLLAIGFIVATALLPVGAWPTLILFTALLWGAVVRSAIGLGTILKRALVALPFAAVAVSIVFARPGEPLFSFGLGPITFTATDQGLIAFLTILWKSWLSVQAAMLLTATTHFTDLLQALHALRMPTVLVAILSFAYRYLFVLVDEGQRMLRARECRSATIEGRKSGGSLGWRAAVVGRMVGTLFLRSYERSERIYVAMLSRGYTGTLYTRSSRPLGDGERGSLVITAALLACLVWLAYQLG